METGRVVGKGRAAEVYEWGEGKVLKLFYDWFPDALIEREARKALISLINEAPLMSKDKKNKIINFVRELPGGSSLCHGDFHPENILISSNNTWVIDWDNV